MTIRPAAITDHNAIYHLNKIGLGYDYPLEKTQQRLTEILQKPHVKFLVAEIDGAFAGYIHAADYDTTSSDPMVNVIALVVDDAFRGKGVGRALLTAAENWAREIGAVGVRLVSSEYRHGAHRFYENCGYTSQKMQKNFKKVF